MKAIQILGTKVANSHQIKALAMMAEKEGGVLEGAKFNSLWEVTTSPKGTKRYSKGSE